MGGMIKQMARRTALVGTLAAAATIGAAHGAGAQTSKSTTIQVPGAVSVCNSYYANYMNAMWEAANDPEHDYTIADFWKNALDKYCSNDPINSFYA